MPTQVVSELVATDLVEYIVLAAPDLDSMAGVVPALADLVACELVSILDLIALEKGDDGRVTVLEVEAVASMAGLASVEGEVGGMLSETDIDLVSRVVRPGTAAFVLVVEDRWAERLSTAVRGAGGEVAAGERIPRARVEAAMARRLALRSGASR
jgi:uncharacterized membrane protein